jgi:hypothetical protein
VVEIHDEFDCREEIYNILIDYGFVLHNEAELTIGINQKIKIIKLNMTCMPKITVLLPVYIVNCMCKQRSRVS